MPCLFRPTVFASAFLGFGPFELLAVSLSKDEKTRNWVVPHAVFMPLFVRSHLGTAVGISGHVFFFPPRAWIVGVVGSCLLVVTFPTLCACLPDMCVLGVPVIAGLALGVFLICFVYVGATLESRLRLVED